MNKYINFLSQYDYDVRKTADARWIDQKCTYDVLSMIADCILEYVDNTQQVEFTVSDIWQSEYARNNIMDIFSKPDPKTQAKNEYDKYFSQPIKLLGYSKVLNVITNGNGNRYSYSINNREILEDIAYKKLKDLEFLTLYIEKVLYDSGLFGFFLKFFQDQTPAGYLELKNKFTDFTIVYTNINGRTECGRIFTKILNPLAFKYKKKGTERGRISKENIKLTDLQYNRVNWRDELSGKDKNITRVAFMENVPEVALAKYNVNKVKKELKLYNQRIYYGVSEVPMDSESQIAATQAHHIFPQNEFPDIADCVENLIMLTPNQHLTMAHPQNYTACVDRQFQYICLKHKMFKIMENIYSNSEEEFYNFENYKKVLAIGLKNNSFLNFSDNDFAGINKLINYCYSDCLSFEVIDWEKYFMMMNNGLI